VREEAPVVVLFSYLVRRRGSRFPRMKICSGSFNSYATGVTEMPRLLHDRNEFRSILWCRAWRLVSAFGLWDENGTNNGLAV